jgi:hypothetical protein
MGAVLHILWAKGVSLLVTCVITLLFNSVFNMLQILTCRWEIQTYTGLPQGRNCSGKGLPVTGCEGSDGCETLRHPHFLDNLLTDGGETVSLTHQPPFTPQEDSWYSFLLEAELTPGP